MSYFNDDQRSHMNHMTTLKPEEKCACGWNRKGDCHNPQCVTPPSPTPPPAISEPTAEDSVEQYLRGTKDQPIVQRWRVDHLLHNLDATRVHLHAALRDVERLRAENASLRAKCAALEQAGDAMADRMQMLSQCECGTCQAKRNWTAAKALAPGDTGGEGRTM